MKAQFFNRVREFFHSESAVTVTQYAMMLGLIVLLSVGSLLGIGGTVSDTFAALDSGVTAAMP